MIDTKLLRQKILDLAIRGKLVPQDPSDEPASELLKRIRVERAKLVKEKIIKKPKNESFIFRGDDNRPYENIDGNVKCIEEEIPFDVPDGWEWVRLGNLCSKIGSGKTPTGGKRIYVSSGIPFIREQNVHNDGIHLDGLAFITEKINKEMQGSQVRAKDILMNITGGSIGRAALVDDDFTMGNINQHILIIRSIDFAIRQYLLTALHSPFVVSLMFSKQTGDKPGLSAEKVNRFLIPLPPLAEQNRIAAQVEALLAVVDKLDANAASLDDLVKLAKQKVLDLAIKGKLVLQDPNDEPASVLLDRIRAEKEALIKAGKLKRDKHESSIFRGEDNCHYEKLNGKTVCIEDDLPFEIPLSWQWIRFGNLVNFRLGKTPARDNAKNWVDGVYPWVTISDMIPNGTINGTKEQITKMAASGSFADKISPTGTLIMSFKLTIGRVSLLGVDAFHNEAIISIFPFLTERNILRDYLMDALPLLTEYVNASPAVKGNTLNKESLKSMLIPLPPLAEQKRIVTAVEAIEKTMQGL